MRLAMIGLALLAGCADAPQLAPFSGEFSSGRAPRALGVHGLAARQVVAIGGGVEIEADTRPAVVSEVGAPFCKLAATVLGDVGKVAHSCRGSGSMSFDSGPMRPGDEVVSAFLRAVTALGGSVVPAEGGGLLVTQGASGAAVAAPEGQQPRASEMPPGAELSPGLVVMPGDQAEQVFRSVASAAVARATTRSAVGIYGDRTLDDVRGTVEAVGLPIRAHQASGGVVVSGPPAALDALRAVLSGSDVVRVQTDLGGLSSASVQALAQVYAPVELVPDPDSGVVYLVGPVELVRDALGSLHRVQSAAPLVLLDVQVLEFESEAAVRAGLDALRIGPGLGPDRGDLGGGASYQLGLTLGQVQATVSGLASQGSARALARPSLRFRSGGSARFQSGVDVPVPQEREAETGGDVVRSFTYRSTGVVLEASGSVLADGSVSLEVLVEVSTATDGNGDAPRFAVRSARSSFLAANGETVLISGLASQSDARGQRGPARGLPLAANGASGSSQVVVLITARAEGFGRGL